MYEVTAIFLIDKAKNKKEAESLAKAEMLLGTFEFNTRKLSDKEFKEIYGE